MAIISSSSLTDGHDYQLTPGDRLSINSKCALGKITVTKPSGNGVTFDPGGTGSIGELIVDGVYNSDCVRVTGAASGPFVVESGYLGTAGRADTSHHQDGIQAGGGHDIEFRRLVIESTNMTIGSTQGIIIQALSGGRPTNIRLVDSVIGGKWTTLVNIGGGSSNCSVENLLCGPSNNGVRIDAGVGGSQSKVKIVAANDPVLQACLQARSVEPWLGGGPPPPDGDPTIEELQAEIVALQAQLSVCTDERGVVEAELARLNLLFDEIAAAVSRR